MGALATLPKLLPIVLAFGSGVLFARWRVIAAESSKAFSDFAFLLAIPCLLFVDLYQSNLSVLFDWQAIGGYILSAAITFLNSLARIALRCVAETGFGRCDFPRSPLVAQRTAFFPPAIRFSRSVPAHPKLSSSGCATTTSSFFPSSSNFFMYCSVYQETPFLTTTP